MLYKIKTADKIQDVDFYSYAELADEIIEALQLIREYETINIIANADVITNVLRVLIVANKEFGFGMVDIDGGGFDYTGEYIMSIGYDYKIWIEPIWCDNKLIDSKAYITYLYSDCNYRIIKKLAEQKASVLIFDFIDKI